MFVALWGVDLNDLVWLIRSPWLYASIALLALVALFMLPLPPTGAETDAVGERLIGGVIAAGVGVGLGCASRFLARRAGRAAVLLNWFLVLFVGVVGGYFVLFYATVQCIGCLFGPEPYPTFAEGAVVLVPAVLGWIAGFWIAIAGHASAVRSSNPRVGAHVQ